MEYYPDIKRGGGVFAKNSYEVLRSFGLKVYFITLFRHLRVSNPHIISIRGIPSNSRLAYILNLLLYIIFTLKAILRLRPHFIISNGLYESIVPFVTRTPFAIVLHDDSPFTVGIVTKSLLPILLSRASLIICPSNATAKNIKVKLDRYTRKHNRKKIFIVNNFVEKSKFKKLVTATPAIFYKRYPYLKDKVKILFVGAFSPHKGVHALIKAVNKLREKMPNVYLILVGPGCEPKRHKISQEGIIFAGTLNDEELASFIIASDIIAIPSVGSEGFGIAVLEAMTVGKPLIIGNLPAFREVAENAAIYVNGHDQESIYSALRYVLNNKNLAYDLISRSRQRSKIYSFDRARQQYWEIIRYFSSIISK